MHPFFDSAEDILASNSSARANIVGDPRAFHVLRRGMTFIYATNRLSWLSGPKSSSLCPWLLKERVLVVTRPSSSHLAATSSRVCADTRCATSAARTSETEKATATSASISDQTEDEAVPNARSAICTDVKMTKW